MSETGNGCTYDLTTDDSWWHCTGQGYLYDTDYEGFDESDVSNPCPRCNTKEYLSGAKEFILEKRDFMKDPKRLNFMWSKFVELANKENPEATEQALKEILEPKVSDYE